jgi:hypothetical protein
MLKIIPKPVKYCDVENCQDISLESCICCKADYCYDHHLSHGQIMEGEHLKDVAWVNDTFICNKCLSSNENHIKTIILAFNKLKETKKEFSKALYDLEIILKD